MRVRICSLLLLAVSACFAQAPDISTGLVSFSGTGGGTPLFVGTGGGLGAVVWRLTYYVDGANFTAAQVAIQGGNATTAAGCASASYTTITTSGSSYVEAVNPSASAARGSVGVLTYYPCVRANVTAVTGSGGHVYVTLSGWKDFFNFPVVATFTPSGTQDVNLLQVGGTAVVTGGVNGSVGVGGLAADGAAVAGRPVLVAGHDVTSVARTLQTDSSGQILPAGVSAVQSDGSSNTPTVAGVGSAGAVTVSTVRDFPFRFNGSTWDREFGCTNQLTISTSSSGNVEIIPASGSTLIRICHLSVATGTPENIKFTRGTGTNCGTGTTDITGTYQSVSALAFDFTPAAALRGVAGSAICINQANGQAIGGLVIYAQY